MEQPNNNLQEALTALTETLVSLETIGGFTAAIQNKISDITNSLIKNSQRQSVNDKLVTLHKALEVVAGRHEEMCKFDTLESKLIRAQLETQQQTLINAMIEISLQ